MTYLVCAASTACSSDGNADGGSPNGDAGAMAGTGGRKTPGLGGAGGLVAMGGLGAAAGTSGAGGAAGSMSAPPLVPDARCAPPPQAASDALIDDLDDGDNQILPTEGRHGYWFTFHDASADGMQSPTGMFEPTPGGRDGSGFAAHTRGSGFSLWGAGMGLSLNARDGLTCSYDAATCSGVSFWAKSDSTAPDAVRMRVATAETTPQRNGGSCGPPYDTWCRNDFGVTVTLTGEWKQYNFEWSELSQEPGWGLLTPFNPSRLVLVQWQVPSNVSFDFWIDDVAFTGCSAEGGMAGASGAD